MEGIVRKASYLGKHVEYGVESAAGELFVVDHVRKVPLPSSTPVFVSLSESGVVIVPAS